MSPKQLAILHAVRTRLASEDAVAIAARTGFSVNSIRLVSNKNGISLKRPKITTQNIKDFVSVTESGCWEWQFCRTQAGYGMLRYGGRSVYSHRRAWELFKGKLPASTQVLHHCDNPPCCNPEHLFLGTQRDNMQDAKKKGRTAYGFKAKLTWDQVRSIREHYKTEGTTCRTLAEKFGVSAQNISEIVRGILWKEPRPTA